MTFRIALRGDLVRSVQRNGHELFSSLELFLSPLWKTSQLGFLLPWCHSSTKSSCLSLNALRYIGVGITVFITIILTIFNTFQLIMAARKQDIKMYDITSYLTWCFPSYVTLAGQLDYLLRRRLYLSFFQDWKSKFNGVTTGNYKAAIVIYTVYFGMISWFLVTMTWILFTHTPKAERPMLMIDYSLLSDLFTAPVLNVVTLISLIASTFFYSMSDIVPTFVYYHASSLLQILESQLSEKLLFKREGVQRLWITYDNVCRVVSSGNDLFGLQVVIHQGFCFAMICIFLFNLLHNRSDLNSQEYWTLVGSCSISTFRLLWTIIMMAQLHRSSERLRTTVASIVSRSVIDGPIALRWFLSSLEHDHLAACPLGFYKITHSILLTMLSLIVTYTVILLQSD